MYFKLCFHLLPYVPMERRINVECNLFKQRVNTNLSLCYRKWELAGGNIMCCTLIRTYIIMLRTDIV
jgi:hypothetical protein